jgi:hypothetical protein
MNSLRSFKQRLDVVSRLWGEHDYDKALTEVEGLLELLPGNPHLLLLKASLIQLQEEPKYELSDVKKILEHAVELDKDAPAASIELGHFLDNVEDDLGAAMKAYASATEAARRLLIEGLFGQARIYRQLENWDEFDRCATQIALLNSFLKVRTPYVKQFQELMERVLLER